MSEKDFLSTYSLVQLPDLAKSLNLIGVFLGYVHLSMFLSPELERRDSHRKLDNFEKLGFNFSPMLSIYGVQNPLDGPFNLLYN